MTDDVVVTIDFEGSSLRGYPIEIGLARWTIGEGTYRSWSSLIMPTYGWLDDGEAWTAEADRIHRIPRTALGDGMSPKAALAAAGEFSGGRPCHSDGFDVDLPFMFKLASAAGAPMMPIRSAYEFARGRATSRRQLVKMLNPYPGEATPRHRAEPDAADTLQRLAHGLGYRPLAREAGQGPKHRRGERA